jgi:hypothetical protein
VKNKCGECGVCCTNTEMFLSKSDIKLIFKKIRLKNLNLKDFTIKNKIGLYQLKNINEMCFFYNKNSKKCSIYNFRPKGCRFYPLIYDIDKKNCVFDKDCPKPNLFYENVNEIKKTCNKIKGFLRNELELNI